MIFRNLRSMVSQAESISLVKLQPTKRGEDLVVLDENSVPRPRAGFVSGSF